MLGKWGGGGKGVERRAGEGMVGAWHWHDVFLFYLLIRR
ncbi:MAG: hypothetical protein JWL81_2314 [Verrucomicrobiales bacterium]|nr:hypothetical protein [Verrucomicrobiales bacterium]